MNPFANMTPAMIEQHNARVAQRRADYAKGNPFAEPAQPIPAPETGKQGADREADLHELIFAECRRRGWIPLHGAMSERTARTLGEWDFTVVSDRIHGISGPSVIFIEVKTRLGKLSPAQQALHAQARKLGHEVFIIRKFSAFLDLVDGGQTI